MPVSLRVVVLGGDRSLLSNLDKIQFIYRFLC